MMQLRASLEHPQVLECINNTEPIDWREGVQRWVPRLLGISPLLIMAIGILLQGSLGMEIGMVGVLAALCAALIGFYLLIHDLTENRYKGESAKSWRSWLMEPASADTNWLERACKNLIRLLTASAFPIEAIRLIYIYSCDPKPLDGSAIPGRMDLMEHLESANLAIPSDPTERERLLRGKDVRISLINNIPVEKGIPKPIEVDGGSISVQRNDSKEYNFYFIPDLPHLESKRSEHKAQNMQYEVVQIPYTIDIETKDEGNPNAKGEKAETQTDSGVIEIRVNINSKATKGNRADGFQPQDWIFKKTTVLMGTLSWIFNYVLKLRVQFLIFLVTLALFQTAQVKDILLSMILDQKPIHFWMASLTGVVLSVMLWHTARQLTRLFPVVERTRKGQSTLSFQRQGIFSNEVELFLFWTAWFSLALFTTPIAREAFGGVWISHLIKPYILFALGAMLIASWRFLDKPISTWTRSFQINFGLLLILGILAPFIFSTIVSSASAIPNFMGSVALLFWALSLFLILGTTLYQFSIITSFPLLSLLIITLYFVNMNRLNDNHMVRLFPAIGPTDGQKKAADRDEKNYFLPSLEDAITLWLNQRRPEIEAFEKESKNNGKKYPIYVVSAQGGGIFAAYHSAKALAVLSDQIPNFSNHLFAISGVSGGSIGSTIYANALRTQGGKNCKTNNLSQRIDEYFDNGSDRMATILSALLFGDMTQRFFPRSVAVWDRSLGLELAFENGRAPENGHPIKLNAPFYATQDPRFNASYTLPASQTDCGWRQAAPYLVLNTTEVSNGRRHLLSPFRLPLEIGSSRADGAAPPMPRLTDADFYEPWLHQPKQGERRDMRFSTAAGMSARFPIVSPYGFFPEAFDRRFIDGGLYDNSGAITAYEIIDSIRRLQEAHKKDQKNFEAAPAATTNLSRVADLLGKVVVYPIAIVDDKAVNLSSNDTEQDNKVKQKGFTWFGWTALDAVLSTREARLQKAVDLLSKFDQESPTQPAHPRRVLLRKDFYLGGRQSPSFTVPLGWKLSCQARAFINDQIQPIPPSFSQQLQKIPRNRDGSLYVPTNNDGSAYSRLPCEIEGGAAQAIQRMPVESPPGDSNGATSSRPFWWLIQQLKLDLDPQIPLRQR